MKYHVESKRGEKRQLKEVKIALERCDASPNAEPGIKDVAVTINEPCKKVPNGSVSKELHLQIKATNIIVKELINLIKPEAYFTEKTLRNLSENKPTVSKGKHWSYHKMTVTNIQEQLQSQIDPKKRKTDISALKVKLRRKLEKLKGSRCNSARSEIKRKAKERLKEKKKQSKNQNKKEKRKLKKQQKTTENKQEAEVKNNGKIVFSKLDFSMNPGEYEKLNGKFVKFHGKDYKKLLEKVKCEKKKLAEIQQKDAQFAATVKLEKIWEVALDKAEGIKVKNDPKLLKKALKRKESKKARSKKQWEKRLKDLENRQLETQKKRKANIEAHKQEKKNKLMKRALKRGRILPGML